MKIAAIGDIHMRVSHTDRFRDLFRMVSKEADVLLICGDLTEQGAQEEAAALKTELEQCAVPVVAVLGNHDYDLNQEAAIRNTLRSENVNLLDGETVEIDGVGFAGVSGFGGGFGPYLLPQLGEKPIKAMVSAGVEEALKLEKALTKLTTPTKIALMHYSPIAATLTGEAEQIYPFLGCSRLEGPLNRQGVKMVFHGHAHNGTLEGKTEKGISVFNVAMTLLAAHGMPVRIEEV